MTSLRPTAGQQRWLKMASRLQQEPSAPWLAARAEGWRTTTVIARCAFFVLGVVASGLTAGIFELLHVPGFLLVTGLLLVGGAEWLIVRRRFFSSGIEEALEFAGSLMIAFHAADIAGGAGPRLPWLVAGVLLATGLRLLNPLFVTLSVAALSYAIHDSGLVHSAGTAAATIAASAFCFAVAGVALFLNRSQFRRPAYDDMLNWLIISMPLPAYLWYQDSNPPELALATLRHLRVFAFFPLVLVLGFGLVALLVGIRRRVHAPLIAAMICAGCAAFEIRNLTPLPLKVKLIFGGSAALFLMMGLDRYLRTPRRGITSNEFARSKGSLDLLQLAGVGALDPPTDQPVNAPFQGGGGRGGGGRASGNY